MTHKYERTYYWFLRISRKLSERQILIILAVIVGLLAGFATYAFEWLLHVIKEALVEWFPSNQTSVFFLFYPIVGIILVTLFVRYIVRDNISEGVTRVLYAISRKNSYIKSHNNWTSVAASATTIGFGGSVGPEAPIVLTGASIGSNVAKVARLNYKNSTLMLCCGAGAALAAIFKAPITGVVFVLEILMLDITVGSVIPLLIASVTATTTAIMMRGFAPILAVTLTDADTFHLAEIPVFIVLGVITGLMGYYLTYANEKVGALYKRLGNQYQKWLVGGLVIGLLIYIFPPLYGEGYEGITALMNGEPYKLFDNSLFYTYKYVDWVIILFLLATMLFKVIAMASTTAAGGVGGTFAPSLFVGAFSGAFLALLCNMLFGWHLSVVSFTLVGMAGVMSGVMNAPLTSIFLIAELSGGYELFIPLMLVASISFAVNYYLEPESIYTKPLSAKGELLTHDKDKSTMVFLSLDKLMETDFIKIKPFYTLGDLVGFISSAKRNIFPVVDDFGKLVGIVQLDDLREVMFKPELYTDSVMRYMIQPPDKIVEHELIQSVLKRFEDNNTWMLPVIKSDNTYIGFISKSRILASYREHLIKISQ